MLMSVQLDQIVINRHHAQILMAPTFAPVYRHTLGMEKHVQVNMIGGCIAMIKGHFGPETCKLFRSDVTCFCTSVLL